MTACMNCSMPGIRAPAPQHPAAVSLPVTIMSVDFHN